MTEPVTGGTPRFIEQTLMRMVEAQVADLDLLVRLWFHLRPHANQPLAAAHDNLRTLIGLLTHSPAYTAALRAHLLALFSAKKPTRLLTEAGLLPYSTFADEFKRRISYKLLPPKHDTNYLRGWLDMQITPRDRDWVNQIDLAEWTQLCQQLQLQSQLQRDPPGVLTNAIISLSHRIASGGLDPELLRVDPSLEQYDSPFLALHHEVDLWLRSQVDDTRQIDVLLEQCGVVLDRVLRSKDEVGTSIDLTLQSTRLVQQMARMRTLIALIDAPAADPASNAPHSLLARLFVELIESSDERYSVSNLIRDTTGRLARQIGQFASQTGERYLVEDRSALYKMFWAASGGGVIVAGMALLKTHLVALHLAPLQEALLVSLNYALGFVLVYLLHLTIATKQPAMTASLFARLLTDVRSHTAQQKLINEFADKVWRSQSVAILGNMLFAFATAVAVALALKAAGHPAVSIDKAVILLDEINPFQSAALFYAAIAGVGLFLSGIVSGYYDNKTVYQRIPERLLCLRLPLHLLGPRAWQGIVEYLRHHFGGIMGNLFFGFYLGLTSAFGHLAGLPIDIRHIAFSAANLGYAWQAFDWQLALPIVLVSIVGVVLIGMVNLAVSFSVAFYLALRATRTSRSDSGKLLGRGLSAILKAPFRWKRTNPKIKDAQ
jgi:site-specific recombinase